MTAETFRKMSRKEAFCLLSDSEDSLLEHDSPIFGTSKGGVDVEVHRAIQASEATFAVEEERRRSFGSAVENREDSGSDEDLEVLPPSDRKPPAKRKVGGPRLSISGGEQDPVQLLSDDDSEDDDSVDISGFLGERLAAKLKGETKNPSVADSKGGRLALDLAADDSSASDVSVSAAKIPAQPVRKKAPPPPTTTTSYAAKKSSTLSKFDSSDSESSIAAWKQTLQASRQPKMMQLDSSDDDEDSLDGKPAIADKAEAAKTKKASAATKTVSRKKAPPVDAERKLQEKREKEERRQQERLEKHETKQREKEDRALKKKHHQVAKQAAKDAEKSTKKRCRDEAGQATGKFASQEIAVLMERSLCRHATWNLVDEVKEAGYYSVDEYPSLLGCNAIQWIRKDFLEGGAADALQMLHAGNPGGYQHLPTLAIVFDVPHDFIQLLEREEHDEEDDYPKLQKWLLGVQAGWKAAWNAPGNSRPRIILLLHQVPEALDHLWVNHRKRKRKEDRDPPTGEELYDAITWILIQFQVECIHCRSVEDVSHNINKMTRLLSEEPYIRQVTELECIKKIKAGCTDIDPPYERSKDCWVRQLQQVPRISLQKARNLTRHYPTASSLWDVYQDEDLTEDEKRMLVSDLFDQAQSRQVKLSDWLYRVMTSEDPNEILR